MYASPDELNRWLRRESGGEPVQVATESADLLADLKKGLTYVRKHGGHARKKELGDHPGRLLESPFRWVQNVQSALRIAISPQEESGPMSRNRSQRPPAIIRKASVDDNTRLLIEATVDELIKITPRAGFSIRDLNHLLDSGMELHELIDCIAMTALKRAA